MATGTASGHQGDVKDPEQDGRVKGRGRGEAAEAQADGSHPDEKDHAGTRKAGSKAQDDGDHAAKADHGEGKAAGSKAADDKAHDTKPADRKGSDDADLKAREDTDAQRNVHHHFKTYMESHKGP